MKIMHMISGGDVGGAKTHVLSLVQGLMATDTVRLVCFTEGEFAADARKMGIPTTVLQDNNLLRVRRSILEMIRADGAGLGGVLSQRVALFAQRCMSFIASTTSAAFSSVSTRHGETDICIIPMKALACAQRTKSSSSIF